jgi:hypothetical protein
LCGKRPVFTRRVVTEKSAYPHAQPDRVTRQRQIFGETPVDGMDPITFLAASGATGAFLHGTQANRDAIPRALNLLNTNL